MPEHLSSLDEMSAGASPEMVEASPETDLAVAVARWEDEGGSVGHPVSPDRESTRDELIAQVKRWWKAWADEDLDTLAQMAAKNYREMTDMREWRQLGRETFLESAARFFAASTLSRWRLFDIAVHVFETGEPLAVCTYRFSLFATLDGGIEKHYEGSATDVLIREGDSWKYFCHLNNLSHQPHVER